MRLTQEYDERNEGPPRLQWDDDESQQPGVTADPAGSARRSPITHRRHIAVAVAGGVAGVAILAFAIGGSVSSSEAETHGTGGPDVAVATWLPTRDAEASSPASQEALPTQAVEVETAQERALPPSPELPTAMEQAEEWDPLEALSWLPVLADGSSLATASYDRDLFGQEWLDVDRNGCDTRNDILRRDLADVVVKEGTQGCVAYSGHFIDPYSAQQFDFERGAGNAGQLHVDHIVALSDAWHKGAEQWSAAKRAEFANDPMNLTVTLGEINMAKGSKDAGAWVPPDESAWCGFAVQVVWVKDQYDLAVSSDEATMLESLLETCPGSFHALVVDR